MPRKLLLVVVALLGILKYSCAQESQTDSLKELRTKADRGDASAQNNLGVMYEKGQGVSQNYTEAMRWYRKAADQGFAEGQYNLGVMYEKGRGVSQNYTEAGVWFRKAADQGDADAQFNLGVTYYNGYGVPQNYTQAHMWFTLAASKASGDKQKKYSQWREEAARKMTPQQIEEARRLAREWKPSNKQPCCDCGPELSDKACFLKCNAFIPRCH
jgi:TPR repeat protein